LLALGLKKETADMHYYHTVDFEGNEVWYPSIIPYENVVVASDFVGETEICLENNTIPAWSLHRLIEIANLPQYWECISGNWYEEVIASIQSKIHIGELNKEYLEE
jgi:hypothetical protein